MLGTRYLLASIRHCHCHHQQQYCHHHQWELNEDLWRQSSMCGEYSNGIDMTPLLKELNSPFQAESNKNNRKQIISVMKLRVPWEFQEHMGCLGGRPVYTDLEHP